MLRPVLVGKHLCLHGERSPEVGHHRWVTCAYELKRRYADDRERGVVDFQNFPKNKRIGAETRLPVGIAQNHDWICARNLALLRTKHASQRWRSAKLGKIICRHHLDSRTLRWSDESFGQLCGGRIERERGRHAQWETRGHQT